MKKRSIKCSILMICTAICMCLIPHVSIQANTQYEIVFKAGLHGSIYGEKSITYPVVAGTVFPDDPSVTAEEGYVFKGWNKSLPEVGSSVDGKQTYVAQYDVLVSGVNYIVRYVNEDNVEIATPKSSMAEDGSSIVERAKVISGYTYQQTQQTFKVSEKTKDFTFVYTLTNPQEVIRYENETVNQVVNTPDGNQNDAAQGGNQDNTDANDKKEDAKENVKDNTTPLGKGESSNNNGYLFVGIGGILLLLMLLSLYLRKKKQNTVKE